MESRRKPALAAVQFIRHRPEKTLLYQLVERHYPDFLTALTERERHLPVPSTRLCERLVCHTDGDRQFVEILAMVPLYGLDAVAGACATALDDRTVSNAHVVNLLHQAAEPPRVTPLQVSAALVPRDNQDESGATNIRSGAFR